jgi:hypothetical protein
MIASHGVAFLQHVPSHESTIMSNYVVPIMKRTEERLLDLMSRMQGTFTMSVDGVTVGGHRTPTPPPKQSNRTYKLKVTVQNMYWCQQATSWWYYRYPYSMYQ